MNFFISNFSYRFVTADLARLQVPFTAGNMAGLWPSLCHFWDADLLPAFCPAGEQVRSESVRAKALVKRSAVVLDMHRASQELRDIKKP
jgi:hypothetical protein